MGFSGEADAGLFRVAEEAGLFDVEGGLTEEREGGAREFAGRQKRERED